MTGLAATSAPYVMRFDADDVLEPGALTALAAALDARPEAVAAWGDVQTFGLTTFRIPGLRALDPWLVTYVNCITGSGNLIRRDRREGRGVAARAGIRGLGPLAGVRRARRGRPLCAAGRLPASAGRRRPPGRLARRDRAALRGSQKPPRAAVCAPGCKPHELLSTASAEARRGGRRSAPCFSRG